MIVFFFKQKTAYEMRISDWSSDVCSSDLPICKSATNSLFVPLLKLIGLVGSSDISSKILYNLIVEFLNKGKYSFGEQHLISFQQLQAQYLKICRSEERRVGKACVSPCRSRW